MSSPPSRKNNEIKPDLPQMRSVMIGSAPSSSSLSAADPFLSSYPSAMQMPRRKAVAPPTKLQVVTTSQSNNKSSRSTATATASSATNNHWNPQPGPLPDFYLLERSHTKIESSTPCAVIASRICQHFQKNSIAGDFSDSKASIEAETSDHTCFCVNLFSSPCGGTIVEVQRLSGCCVSFRQSCRSILQAAKGVASSSSNASSASRKRGMSFRVPPSLPPIACQDETVTEAVDINANLLMQPSAKMDAQLLGLEGLTQLTSGSSSSSQTNKCAAKTILSKESLVDQLMEYTMLSCAATAADEPSNSYQYSDKLRRHSLCILANCLELCGRRPSPKFHDELFCTGLQTILQSCSDQPHEACHAAKILTLLAPLGSTSMNMGDLVAVASQAHQEGRCQHALLEQEALRLKASCV